MKKIAFMIVDIICFVGGSSIFTRNLFSYRLDVDGIWYMAEQQSLLAISIGLIVLGFLIRNWKKQN